jgi:hypothetical protein
MSMIGNFLRIAPAQLDALLTAPNEISAFLYEEKYRDDPAAVHRDIDKSWRLIHFLLTGDPWQGDYPFGAVVMGGIELGQEDVGYGPARYLWPNEVREVAAAVEGVSEQELWRRFDAKRALEADIYLQGWTDDDSEYILGNFKALKQFYSAAARSGQAMPQFVN